MHFDFNGLIARILVENSLIEITEDNKWIYSDVNIIKFIFFQALPTMVLSWQTLRKFYKYYIRHIEESRTRKKIKNLFLKLKDTD
jgi:hypothetical protein